MNNNKATFLSLLLCTSLSGCLGDSVGEFPRQETICDFDSAREAAEDAAEAAGEYWEAARNAVKNATSD